MNEPKKPFWSSIPGVLTGTATVITAVLGLFGALNNSNQPSSDSPPSPSISASATPTATPSAGTGASPEALIDELPEAEVVPASIDFGEQRISSTTSRPVTVANSGSADLEISSVEVEGDGAASFTVPPQDCSDSPVAPGGECDVEVSFTPRSAGNFTATLILEHNAQSTPTRVPLSGEGVLLKL